MKETIKTLLENFVTNKGADLFYPEPQQKGDHFLKLALLLKTTPKNFVVAEFIRLGAQTIL